MKNLDKQKNNNKTVFGYGYVELSVRVACLI